MPVLVYLHGGGWVLGNDPSHANLAATYAATFGYVVIMVDYRLAPEHPFPAAVDDSYAATLWAAENAGGPFLLWWWWMDGGWASRDICSSQSYSWGCHHFYNAMRNIMGPGMGKEEEEVMGQHC